MTGELDASRVCSGTYGKIFVDGEWQTQVSETTADVEIDMKELLTCGSEWTGHKAGAKKGTGSLKEFKVTSKMIENGFKKFEIISELDDPEAYGYERIRLKNCRVTKISLINFKPGEVIENEYPFVFDGYELLDKIVQTD